MWQGVIDLIRHLQQEMAEEQEDFNALKDELTQCDVSDARRKQEITELMVESQDRLASLMDKMSHCFRSQVRAGGMLVYSRISVLVSPLNLRV